MTCPHCSGTDAYLDIRYPKVEDGIILLSAVCENCGSSWTQIYRLTDDCVADLRIGRHCQCDACKFSRGP